MQYDVIVIGAGSAGMPCAIQAAKRGKQVLVLEKESFVGGTLHITAGHLSAGGTNRQNTCGIKDSVEEHWQDVKRISHNTIDEPISKKAIELAPATVNWLEQLGYKFHNKAPLVIYGHEAYSKARTYFSEDDYFGGAITKPGKAVYQALLPHFNQLVAEQLIELRLAHKLTELIVENNEVVAVKCTHNGEEIIFKGKAVVLTTGGYAASQSLFKKFHPNVNLISTANLASTGDGIVAAQQIGAIFCGEEKHLSTLGGIETEPGSGRSNFWEAWARVSNAHDRKPREVYVNQLGQRFMNEHQLTVDQRERIVAQQPGQYFFVVFDEQAIADDTTAVVQWNKQQLHEKATEEKCVWMAKSLQELAEKIKVPTQLFLETIENYNNSITTEVERSKATKPIIQPPFFAIKVHAYSLISFGGIKVNDKLQVINQSGGCFTNLFAAGEILGAAATSGNAFCGGMLLTPAISFGKWLGEVI
jgi:succinate dehydrogenase/fumarate reductase flavoprotein subunit